MPLSAKIHRRIAHNSLKPGVSESNDIATNFFWGDYISLSYTWGDCRKETTIFLHGIAIAVSKYIEAALPALLLSVECQLGMKVWADALCINRAEIVDLTITSCM